MRRFANVLAFLSLGLSALSYYRLKYCRLDVSILVYLLKLMAGAFAPVLAVVGSVGAGLGLLSRSYSAAIGGALGALLSAYYVRRSVAPSPILAEAFGPDWQARLAPQQTPYMLRRRWNPLVPAVPAARVERDVPFWVIPGTSRRLLCDIWQPPTSVPPSGLAVVYMHAGGWQNLDKDRGTRPFFSHLTAQGHVVMDVAYRLCHETDMAGMLGDVKRAIVWLRRHAERYQVDAQRIVAAGGSSGAHLALLAAYTPHHPELDPVDVRGCDTSVCSVVSFYAPTDLAHVAAHWNRPSISIFVTVSRWLGFVTPQRHLDTPELMQRLLGGLPAAVPQTAALMSPLTHVGPHCPPTLLLHGSHDRVVQVEDARVLHRALSRAGVPVAYLELPQAEHAFDLVAPRLSPPAQAALYSVERFLAVVGGAGATAGRSA